MIYTFYSYKGGAGRSMALANVAKYFSTQGLRVTMVDWDLEAPGLETFFFEKYDDRERVRSNLGLIDLLVGYLRQYPGLASKAKIDGRPLAEVLDEELPSLSTTLQTVDDSAAPVRLLAAGWRAGDRLPDYGLAVQTFDWSGMYADYEGEAYFEWMRRQLEGSADVVLIDARTGITEMGGVCTRQLADVVVSFCTANLQSLDGVRAMTESFRRESLIRKRGRDLPVVVVPTRIESSEVDARKAFEDRFHKAVDRFVPLAIRDKSREFDFWQLRIPYVPLYAYGESLAIGAEKPIEELVSAYQQLAGHLALLGSSSNVVDVWDRLQRSAGVGAAPIATVFSVPSAPTPFTGRDEVLEQLEDKLKQDCIVALVGLPGSGKTALAARYSQRHQSEFDVAWWVSAESSRALESGFLKLSDALGLVPTDGGGAAEAVRNWLERNERWLLIFDDAPSPDDLQDFLPRVLHGQCVITSRNRAFATAMATIEVSALTRPESMQYLLRATGSDDGESASAIADELGDLPLALALAARYSQQTGRSLHGVLELLRGHAGRLLEPLEVPLRSVLDEIAEESPEAAALLTLCAFMGRDDIPLDALLITPEALPPELARAATDPFAIDEAIAVLRQRSVVDRGRDGVRVHPVVQVAARERLPPDRRVLWGARALVVLGRVADRPGVGGHVRVALSATTSSAAEAIVDPPALDPEVFLLLPAAADAFERAGRYGEVEAIQDVAERLAEAIDASVTSPELWEARERFDAWHRRQPAGGSDRTKRVHIRRWTPLVVGLVAAIAGVAAFYLSGTFGFLLVTVLVGLVVVAASVALLR